MLGNKKTFWKFPVCWPACQLRGGELQGRIPASPQYPVAPPPPSPPSPQRPQTPVLCWNVRRLGRGRKARPVTAGGVRPCHATAGGVKLCHGAVASPAIGRRLRPVQFAPSPLEFRLRSFFGMDANGNQRVQTVQDLGFLLCAPRCAISPTCGSFSLRLRPGVDRHSRVWPNGGVGVSLFGCVFLGSFSGSIFLGYVLNF